MTDSFPSHSSPPPFSSFPHLQVNDVANYNPSDAAIETLILGEFKTLRGVVTEYVAKSAADREDARRVYTEQAAALDAPLATAQKALTDNAPLLKEIFDRVTIVFSEIRSAIEDDLLDNRTLLLRIAEHLKVRAERVLASVAIDRLRAGIARLELDRNFLTAFRDRLAQITTNDDVTDLELHAFAVDRVQAAIEKEREITRVLPSDSSFSSSSLFLRLHSLPMNFPPHVPG